MEIQWIYTSQNILEKEEKLDKLILSDLKTYYKASVIKTTWNCHKVNKHINQQNRIASPVMNPHMYNQLILFRGDNSVCNTVFSTNSAGTTSYLHAKKMISLYDTRQLT